MKKFGLNKRNPNPPWPSEQPVIVVPPGTSAEAVGMPGEPVRMMPGGGAMDEIRDGSMDTERNVSDTETVEQTFVPERENMDGMNGSADNRGLRFDFDGSDAENMIPKRQTGAAAIPAAGNAGMTPGEALGNGRGIMQGNNTSRTQSNFSVPDGSRRFPLMGNMPGIVNRGLGTMNNYPGGRSGCGSTYITNYLCSQTGKYVRIEFLFGEQTHVEKTGMLREVGRNFIVLQEMGTNSMIVCALNKIKFIYIYDINSKEMR